MVVLDELGDKNNMYMVDLSSSSRFCVKPGKYVAIPSTMNSSDQDSKVLKEFLIRTFTPGPVVNPL
jgi:RAB protein geranylgeranyltransferase component A